MNWQNFQHVAMRHMGHYHWQRQCSEKGVAKQAWVQSYVVLLVYADLILYPQVQPVMRQ